MDFINKYLGLFITSSIAKVLIGYITGSNMLSNFFVIAYILFFLSLKNYEDRDDSLMLDTLLHSSLAFGILIMIMFVNSNYFGVTHKFHSILFLLFLLALPATLINIGTLSVALSN